MNYELGHLDMNGNKNSNNSTSNGKTTKNGMHNLNHLKNGLSSTDSITNDILPSNDDEVKRWSCDMDSNILF